MRVVLDTSVVVAGLQTQLGAGNAVLRQVARRRLVPLASPPLFLEYEEVLKRPEHRLAHGLSLEAIDEFLAELAALIEPVGGPQTPDPNDEMVLEAAINGRANALVTDNVARLRCRREQPQAERPSSVVRFGKHCLRGLAWQEGVEQAEKDVLLGDGTRFEVPVPRRGLVKSRKPVVLD